MSKQIALIVAAGTGGHLYPGLAAARALMERDCLGWEVIFAVRRGDMGRDLIEREGFRVVEFSGQGFPRRLSFKILTFPFKVGIGFCQAWKMLRKIQPNIVIGMGGYLSFSVLTAACLQGIPTLIHEQNVFPGLANKILAKYVRSIAASFEESVSHFPTKKTWISGLPIRRSIGTIPRAVARRQFGLDSTRTTFLIFGGSLGAHHLNLIIADTWPLLSDLAARFQIIHVTGEKDFSGIQALYRNSMPQAVVMPYCHEMPHALAAADLVISRAGASTVAELLVAKRPAILVPYPFASENHQLYNAEMLVRRGLGEILIDAEITPQVMAQRLRPYLENSQRLTQIQQRYVSFTDNASHRLAASRLADFIVQIQR